QSAAQSSRASCGAALRRAARTHAGAVRRFAVAGRGRRRRRARAGGLEVSRGNGAARGGGGRERTGGKGRTARRVSKQPFIVLTGLSGSGKSQAIRALEDLGYFC